MSNEKRVTLVLGGSRSGKSFYAQEAARKYTRVLFVATAEAGDEDMRARIEKHKADRPATWRTLEAPSRLGTRIEQEYRQEELVIIDCITLLVTNLMCTVPEEQYETVDESHLEKAVLDEIAALQLCIRRIDADFIIVSNEVGLGIVPAFRIGRLYRDILGRANQVLAQTASEVLFMVAGIPLRVK